MNDDPRIAMIADALDRMMAGEVVGRVEPAGRSDGLDQLIERVNRLGEMITAQLALTVDRERRFQEFLDVIGGIAALDFSRKAYVSEEGTDLDALALGINMLSEELEAANQVQAAALAELSTPLIPISNRVMVMPLIGAVDSRRAQQVLETLLTGISEAGAAVAILDITGVPVVDTSVANGLIHAAQAVRLLGAEVILTGIRPEVAQTLVGLGVDLRGIMTLSSLQSGIAAALRQR